MTDINALPERLKETARFCVWKYEEVNGRKTKIPYNPRTGKRGDCSNPAAFSPLADAAAVQSKYDGLGVGVFNTVGAIDIDHCYNGGELSALASDIMRTMDTYTEISPSGGGLRLLFTLPPGFKYDTEKYYIHNSQNGVEVYAAGMTHRFLTVTGDTLTPGADMADGEKSAERLQRVLNKYMQRPETDAPNTAPPEPLDMSDRELLDKARASNDTKFSVLYDVKGGWKSASYGSQSDADIALCERLAFWTGRDPVRIDTLFRGSALYREKWERADYREKTIQKAVEACGETYRPDYKTPERPQNAPRTPEPSKGDNSTPEPLKAVKNDSGAFEGQTGETAPPELTPEMAARLNKYGAEMGSFLNSIYTERYKPVKTGLAALDEFLNGGLIPQTLVSLSAEPGAGKTILTSMVFESMARQKIPCFYFNLEMGKEQLLARSLSRMIYTQQQWRVSALDILQGYKHTPELKERIERAAGEYAAEIAPYLAYNPVDTADATDIDVILRYINKAGEIAKQKGEQAPYIALDYLHIITSRRNEAAPDLIKRAVAGLKSYAERYNAIVWVISAQSRATSKEKDATLYAGRDSSSIEYTADLQLQLKVDKPENESMTADPDKMKLYVTKSRFTVYDSEKGLPLTKCGGVSYFQQAGEWEPLAFNEPSVFDSAENKKAVYYSV